MSNLPSPGTPGEPPRGKPPAATERSPRRIVLLRADQKSEVEQVLAEYQGNQVSGNRLHADLKRLAEEHPGRFLAGEWLGPLGWTRFLWNRQEARGG